MRCLSKFAALIGCLALFAGSAYAHKITVGLNKSEALKIGPGAASISIGNPDIADVSVQSDRLLFITGLTYGTTNLLVLDAQGRSIFKGDIVVNADRKAIVTINRAGADSDYHCTPNCQTLD